MKQLAISAMRRKRKSSAVTQCAISGSAQRVKCGLCHEAPTLPVTRPSCSSATKPNVGLYRHPGRQRNLVVIVAAHAWAMHLNLAAMESNLAFGFAPALPNTALPAAIQAKEPARTNEAHHIGVQKQVQLSKN